MIFHTWNMERFGYLLGGSSQLVRGVISSKSTLPPLSQSITRAITYLLSGMKHQVLWFVIRHPGEDLKWTMEMSSTPDPNVLFSATAFYLLQYVNWCWLYVVYAYTDHIYIYIWICICVCACMHVCMCICICICIYTYIHMFLGDWMLI